MLLLRQFQNINDFFNIYTVFFIPIKGENYYFLSFFFLSSGSIFIIGRKFTTRTRTLEFVLLWNVQEFYTPTMNSDGSHVLLSVEAEAYVEHLVKFGIKDIGGRR